MTPIICPACGATVAKWEDLTADGVYELNCSKCGAGIIAMKVTPATHTEPGV